MSRGKPQTAGLSFVMPCLDEARTVESVVRDAMEAGRKLDIPFEVIVADNGSRDGSPAIAVRAGARVVAVGTRGYGAALDAGIRASRYSTVVFGDADCSYDFRDAPRLAGPVLRGEAELVLGSRLRGTIRPGAMPLLNRYLGTPVLSWLLRRLFRLPVSDCNSGMRAVARHAYESLGLRSPGMEFASEMLIRAAQRGLRYAEAPISFSPDRRGRAPHLRRWRDGWRHLRFLVANAPSLYFTLPPVVVGAALLALAYVHGLTPWLRPGQSTHFHSAFACIAAAATLLNFGISGVLMKASLHHSAQLESRFVLWLQSAADRGFLLLGAFLCLAAAGGEIAWLVVKWARAGWGSLSEIESSIRLTVSAIGAAMLFGLDMGLAMLALLPTAATEDVPAEKPAEKPAKRASRKSAAR